MLVHITFSHLSSRIPDLRSYIQSGLQTYFFLASYGFRSKVLVLVVVKKDPGSEMRDTDLVKDPDLCIESIRISRLIFIGQEMYFLLLTFPAARSERVTSRRCPPCLTSVSWCSRITWRISTRLVSASGF
jgi:hypothetical protein